MAQKKGLMVGIIVGHPTQSGAGRAQMAEDTERMMTGRKPLYGTEPDADDSGDHGSPVVGYMPPQNGPFRCDNCVHYHGTPGDNAPGQCDDREVQSDPQVRGRVQGGGCCNEFQSRGNAGSAGPTPLTSPIPTAE